MTARRRARPALPSTLAVAAAVLAALAVLSGCSNPPTTPVSGPAQGSYQGRADGHPWDSAPNSWSGTKWKQGDRVSWEDALRQRNQHQSEYERTN